MAFARGIVSHTGLSRKEAVVTNLWASLLGGQVAGLVFAVFLMVVYPIVLGRSILDPLRIMGALFRGPDVAHNGGAGAIILGLIANQVVALLWSLVYWVISAFSRERFTLNHAMMLGFIIGGFAVLLDVYAIMPVFQRGVNGVNVWARNVWPIYDWLAHAAFGLSLGLAFFGFRNQIETTRLCKRGVAHKTTDPSHVHRHEP